MAPDRQDIRVAAVLAVLVAAVIALAIYGPITQPSGYNAFADQRTILGVPNFWNVVSNVPFVFVGAWGLALLLGDRPLGVLAPLRAAWVCVFGGTVLVGLGSSYYHLAPSDATLAWDRLPMALVFMALFTIVLGEWVSLVWASRLLFPLLLLGAGSVAYWRLTGDLRIYILVQYLPGLLIPIILVLFRPALRPASVVWAGLGLYGLAKALEILDAPVYRVLGAIGGHPLRHIAAACAIGAFVLAAYRRHPPPSARHGS